MLRGQYRAGILPEVTVLPGGHVTMPTSIFDGHKRDSVCVQLASCKRRLEMLIKSLPQVQSPLQRPTQHRCQESRSPAGDTPVGTTRSLVLPCVCGAAQSSQVCNTSGSARECLKDFSGPDSPLCEGTGSEGGRYKPRQSRVPGSCLCPQTSQPCRRQTPST